MPASTSTPATRWSSASSRWPRRPARGRAGGIGGFGALFEVPKRYKEPVLVSGTDGVGTKLKLAFEWNMHDTVGIDLVAMSVNDVLVQGAEPLFFLDYFACGKLDVDTAAAVVGGIAKGCELSGCALIGGETAEMPGMYPAGEYDLAGFAVGVVEKSKILTGQSVAAGDVVLGLGSSGVHSNGFSLVRKCIERAGAQLPATLDGQPFRQAVMAPTRLYVKSVLAALAAHPHSENAASPGGIKALAHITGGGLLENIPRVLPDALAAQLAKGGWPQSELFAWLQQTAGIDDTEMNRTFNNGIGMVLVLAPEQAAACAHAARGGRAGVRDRPHRAARQRSRRDGGLTPARPAARHGSMSALPTPVCAPPRWPATWSWWRPC
jgi:phosphoribosylformylglycinamidine cyclo-ligase